jgi:nucleotide sugar dehydrogenase
MNCSVIGIGKLGLCFALTIEKTGCNVIGVDINQDYINCLNDKTFSSHEPGLTEALKKSTRFRATTDMNDALNNSDYIFILVQTPETETSYDHTILENIIANISKTSTPKHIIVNSTVMPGFYATQNVSPHTLSYNPAFVAQGTVMNDYESGGKFGVIVIGSEVDTVKEMLFNLYTSINPNTKINIMSPPSAEIFKIADNTFRVIKIVYANLIGDLCKKTPGANVEDVADALKNDSSIGNICMSPGYGYGGPCYPRDLKALTTYAISKGFSTGLLGGAYLTNEDHHTILLKELLEQNLDEYIFNSFTYRPDMKVEMFDNSPSLRLAVDLHELGKKINVIDRQSREFFYSKINS